MKVYITGIAGFVGSNLAEKMLSEGWEVYGCDNLFTGKLENLPKEIVFERKDISREPLSLKGYDLVIHAAAIASVRLSTENPLLVHETNMTGTLNVLRSVVKAKVPVLVFFSSAAVYGRDGRMREEDPKEPRSLYGATKLGGEHYIRIFSQLHGFNYIILRCFNIYGPRQRWDEFGGVIPKFIYAMLSGKKTYIRGDGSATRDFVYVMDVIGALLHLVKNKHYGTFNIGTERETSIIELHEMIAKITGTDISPEFLPASPDEIRKSVADITRLKNAGYIPRVSLEEGLRKTVEYYKHLLSR